MKSASERGLGAMLRSVGVRTLFEALTVLAVIVLGAILWIVCWHCWSRSPRCRRWKALSTASCWGSTATTSSQVMRSCSWLRAPRYAPIRDVAMIEQVVVKSQPDGVPVLVRDLGSVAIAPMTRQGAVTRDGRGEVVTGMVIMLLGENSRTVVQAAKQRLAELAPTVS